MKFAAVVLLAPLTILVAFLLAGVAVVPGGFIAMLLLGSLHATYPFIPAIGFWTAWKILWLIYIIGHGFYSTNTK